MVRRFITFGSFADWFPATEPGLKRGLCGVLRLCAAALFAFLLVSICQQIRAHQYFSLSKVAPNLAIAAVANIKAHQLFRWDFQIRQQLFVTLSKAMESKQFKMNRNAYELAWKISASASPYFLLIEKHKRSSDEKVFSSTSD